MTNKHIRAFFCLAVFFLACALSASAHAEKELPKGTIQENLQIKGYDFALLRKESPLYTNSEYEFNLAISNKGQEGAIKADVQGQILDSNFGKEIFYAAVTEKEDGTYSFFWKPSFAGRYVIQFILRSSEGEVLQPSFGIEIVDKRGIYSFYGSIIGAMILLGIGLFAALPRNKKAWRFSPLAYSALLALGTVILGYSVSYYYGSGGEKGFVVCTGDECELAVHYHSQLEMSVCGDPYSLPLEAGDLGKQHTHKEKDKLHFHSLIGTDKSGAEIKEAEKLRLGDLFDQLNITFTNDCFTQMCNGQLCNGKAGFLSVEVNDVKIENPSNYSWRDGDVIAIAFG